MILPLVAHAAALWAACAADPCAGYAEHPVVHAQCRVREAAAAPSVEEAGCASLGEREEACRIRWVQAHAERPLDELLAACTTDECRFVALDWQPADLATQVQRCGQLGRLADPCRVHALDRFYGGHPDAAAQAAVPTALGAQAWLAADQAGLAAGCGIAVDCALLGAHAARCEQTRRRARPGEGCLAFRPDFPRPVPP